MGKNILLTIAYDGSRFHGWQKQPESITVQGHLERVMSKFFGQEILLSGTSRTDAGVHAWDQKATLLTDISIPTDRIPRVINNALCAEEKGPFAKAPVRIVDAKEMPEGFHARFDCRGKEYIYRICSGYGWAYGPGDNGRSGSSDGGFAENGADEFQAQMSLIFARNYAYHIKEELDVEAMQKAAAYLVGTQDFKSFEASGGNPRETTVRTIFGAEVIDRSSGGMQDIEFHVWGDGFLYNMVRIITGTLVEVGQGKRRPEDVRTIIQAKDRTRAGHTAPPYGLYLARVFYDDKEIQERNNG